MTIRIRSGGQSGVDRAALDFAIRHRLPYAGWCPKGGWAEDYPHPPGVLALYPRLVETPSADPSQRTEWNVRDSGATLILTRGGELSGGTGLTERCARALQRPCLVVDLARASAVNEAAAWLSALGADLELNVAGPRESKLPGIYAEACEFLDALRALPD